MLEYISSQNAPAAIGPYSQAIKAGTLLFCSGQLGIDPLHNGSEIESYVRPIRAILFWPMKRIHNTNPYWLIVLSGKEGTWMSQKLRGSDTRGTTRPQESPPAYRVTRTSRNDITCFHNASPKIYNVITL